MARIIPMNVLDPTLFDEARQRRMAQRVQGYIPNAPTAPSLQDVAQGANLAIGALSPVANAIVSHVGESNRLEAEKAARAKYEAAQAAPAAIAARRAQADQMQDVAQIAPEEGTAGAQRYGVVTELPPQAPAAPAPLAPVAPVQGTPDMPVFPPLPEHRRMADPAAELAAKAAQAEIPQYGGEMVSARQEPVVSVAPRAAPPKAEPFQDLDELRIRAFLAGQSNDVAEKRAVLMALKQLGEAGYAPRTLGEAFNPHEARNRVVREFQELLMPQHAKVRDPIMDALHAQQIAESQGRDAARAAEADRKKQLFADTKAKLHSQVDSERYKAEIARLDSIAKAPGGSIDAKRAADAAKAKVNADYAERLAQSLIDLRGSQGDMADSQTMLNDLYRGGEISAHTHALTQQALLDQERRLHPERFRSNINIESPGQRRGADLAKGDYEAKRSDASAAEKKLETMTEALNVAKSGSLEPSDYSELLATYPDLRVALSRAAKAKDASVLVRGLQSAIAAQQKRVKGLQDEAAKLRALVPMEGAQVSDPNAP